jgi:hypothetical protein
MSFSFYYLYLPYGGGGNPYIIPTHVPVSNIIIFHIVCIVLFVKLSMVFPKGRSRIFRNKEKQS